MVCNSMLPEQSNLKESSKFPDEKAMERCNNTDNISEPSGEEEESSSVSATTSENHPNSKIKKRTSRKRNSSMRVHSDELETPIEEARLDISNHFENMERQMDYNYKIMDLEVETWTRVGLASIKGEKNPLNDLFIKSLIDNFEEMIGNIELHSKRDVNLTMDEIRKIIVKLVKRIEQNFVPKPFMEDVKVKKRDIVTYLSIGLWSLVAVFICVFPNYALTFFESAVAFYQSTILIFLLFSILYFCSPIFK